MEDVSSFPYSETNGSAGLSNFLSHSSFLEPCPYGQYFNPKCRPFDAQRPFWYNNKYMPLKHPAAPLVCGKQQGKSNIYTAKDCAVKGHDKTRGQLTNELAALQQRVAESEEIEFEREQAEMALQEALNYTDAIIETVREPLVVLDAHLKVLSVNWSFCDTFRVTR